MTMNSNSIRHAESQREINAILNNSPSGWAAHLMTAAIGYSIGISIGREGIGFYAMWEEAGAMKVAYSATKLKEPYGYDQKLPEFVAKATGADAALLREHFHYYASVVAGKPVKRPRSLFKVTREEERNKKITNILEKEYLLALTAIKRGDKLGARKHTAQYLAFVAYLKEQGIITAELGPAQKYLDDNIHLLT